MNEELYKLLKNYLLLLDKSNNILEHSYNLCKDIKIVNNLTYDNMDKFEALTSRFARLSDILIQQVLRLIDMMDLETEGSVRDRINNAEKKGLIDNANILVEIRILRNSIAHEYKADALLEIFRSVLEYTPLLFKIIKKINSYCNKYNEIGK